MALIAPPFDALLGWEEFVERMADDAQTLIPRVREKLGSYQGQSLTLPSEQDVTVTLSGLLGLVWKSGMRGAENWLKNPEDRTKYPNTTKAFISTNGLF